MIDMNNYIRFVPGVVAPDMKSEEDLWFIYQEGKLLLKIQGNEVHIPTRLEIANLELQFNNTYYLGKLDARNCYCGELSGNAVLPEYIKSTDLRSAGMAIGEDLFMIAGKALQIIAWDQTHQYCGKCGTKTEAMASERAKQCPECGLVNYPRISPAIIVAIIKENKILLAHNKRFANNMYSILAGFVEPGETLEECVKREVYEEVGIQVKNIRYYGSQPWPFPNSLMLGFTAEYAGGDIKVDGVEIDTADWFGVDNLPNIPSKISVAGKLIHWFLETYK